MNDGVIGTVFSLAYVSLKGFGVVGSDTYTWGIKDFHKCWSGSLAKRRLCLGPAGVINCTPLSALSFWVSLFPRIRGYNSLSIYLPTCLSIYLLLVSFLQVVIMVVFVQSLSHVVLFATPWTAACKASLSFTVSEEEKLKFYLLLPL